ncbi:zinc finger lsd1 subclass family protein (macronuclear) [Tetrahymena thermophila SB210]|uniref:Zinc finger lsd1 subclass family protein n=1 Tax=Tetrahymena thermophila (strain SB210) TaxID=312017 RepID=Q23F46_TETTS|nr:zinc finger lsd1 subclass family protein [Tetrahymena thermophila SB210]EAR95059.2 zinc finger lsd1 subclass family protein [Tetrahymena thermophila SB210]|eukprot:XP_001015304.2 zinc finger lsd1 subclass family protein [Tetrahymena thermophila SB210]
MYLIQKRKVQFNYFKHLLTKENCSLYQIISVEYRLRYLIIFSDIQFLNIIYSKVIFTHKKINLFDNIRQCTISFRAYNLIYKIRNNKKVRKMQTYKYFLFFLSINYSIIQRVLAQVYYNYHDLGSNLKELSPLLISENISKQTHSIKVESEGLKSLIGASCQAIFELSISSPRNISFIIQDQSQRILHLTLSQSIYNFTIQQIVDQSYLIYTIFSYGNEENVWNLFKIKGLRLFININNYQLKQNISYQNINSSFLRLLLTCNEQQFFHPIYQRCENCHPNCKGCTEYKKCKDCQKAPGKNERQDQLADGFCDPCPSGQTWRPNNICNGCSDTCNCDNKKQCISCKDSSKNQLNVERNTCEPCQLDQRYYIEGQFCKRCNIICKTCKGPSDSDCLQCIDGAKKYEDGSCKYNNQNPNDCVSPYKQDKSQNCVLCNQDGQYAKDKNCVECQADLKCQKCSPETQCTQCSQGYFLKGNVCQQCPPQMNCLTCINENSCESCEPGKFIQKDGKCDKCEQGYYIESKYCRQCKIGCSSCTSYFKCDQCMPQFYKLKTG